MTLFDPYGDDAAVERPRFRPLVVRIPRLWTTLLVVVAAVVGLVRALLLGSGYSYGPPLPPLPAAGRPNAERELETARREGQRLETELRRLAPSRPYIVVDRTNNHIYMWRDGQVQLTALCSAGSGSILIDEAGDRQWVFDTPRGRFEVLKKITDPVWRKPDWAFVEEGLPVPKNPADRIEYGVLGEYGLYFGNGYLIHGTLYERLLGRSVSHGCIRVGRDDLRLVYRAANIGTPIYVF